MTTLPSQPFGPDQFDRGLATTTTAVSRIFRLNRARRILLLIAFTWVMHAFDLGFTILESDSGRFEEINPIAARILHDERALTIYKFSLLTIGSVIILSLRRWPIAEMGGWLMLASSIYVSVRWYCYFVSAATGIENPFIVSYG
ncbi:MAG: DUF5658 family protein [Phycisphaerae bacterium]